MNGKRAHSKNHDVNVAYGHHHEIKLLLIFARHKTQTEVHVFLLTFVCAIYRVIHISLHERHMTRSQWSDAILSEIT